MESMHQPIIPGLPDDLALRCLAMLSHGHHGVMETVSKRWRDVMRSEDYSNYKAREGWCGDWLFVLTHAEPNQWIAYDPDTDRWHPLPPRPHSHYSMLASGHCVYNKFLVVGGRYWRFDPGQCPCWFMSNEVFQFDPFKKEWSRVASMRTSRSNFASFTMDGKIYVAGGWNSDYPYPEGMNLAEVYDPLTDKWEDLPPMPLPTDSCIGIAYEGKFQVIYVRADVPDLYQTEIFDPLSRRWHVKHENWSPRPDQVAVADDQVYSINELESTIERRYAEKDEWHLVGEVPPLFDPNDSKEHEVIYYTLASLGHDLYVIGGKHYTMKDSEVEDVVDFDRARFCDPRCLPLTWRETRPMCLNTSGSIAGWASLKQQ